MQNLNRCRSMGIGSTNRGQAQEMGTTAIEPIPRAQWQGPVLLDVLLCPATPFCAVLS